MDDEIRHPTGFGLNDIVDVGTTGIIYHDETSQTVIKTPHDDEYHAAIVIEQRIYERLQLHGGHKGLLRYHGPYDSGIRLEYAPNFALRSWLRKDKDISLGQKIRWVGQIADALRFVHSMSVIHGDVNSHNVLLAKELDAKLGDFGGSSLDGSRLLIGVKPNHQYPGPTLSIRGDLFALGSTIYEIMAGHDPYHERSVELLYQQHLFPATGHLGPIGEIIARCWRGEYDSTDDVYADIQGLNFSPKLVSHLTNHDFISEPFAL